MQEINEKIKQKPPKCERKWNFFAYFKKNLTLEET